MDWEKRLKNVIRVLDESIIGTDGKFEERFEKGCIILDMSPPQWEEFKKAAVYETKSL